MYKRFFLIIILLFTPLFAGEPLLLVIHAKKGEFTPPEKKDGLWSLKLNNVDQTVAFFSALPGRRAGVLELHEFLSLWGDIESEIKKQEEGVGFVFFEIADTDHNEIAINIENPQYKASTKELLFDAEPFTDDISFTRRELNEITLFIDIEDFPLNLAKTDLQGNG